MITVSHCVNITSPLKLLEADSEHGASGSYLHAQKTWGYSGSVCRTSDHFCTACVHNISVKKDKAHYIRCLTLQRVILKSTKTHYCRSAKENTVPVTLSFLQPAGKAPHTPKAASTSLRGSPRVQWRKFHHRTVSAMVCYCDHADLPAEHLQQFLRLYAFSIYFNSNPSLKLIIYNADTV